MRREACVRGRQCSDSPRDTGLKTRNRSIARLWRRRWSGSTDIGAWPCRPARARRRDHSDPATVLPRTQRPLNFAAPDGKAGYRISTSFWCPSRTDAHCRAPRRPAVRWCDGGFGDRRLFAFAWPPHATPQAVAIAFCDRAKGLGRESLRVTLTAARCARPIRRVGTAAARRPHARCRRRRGYRPGTRAA